MGKVLSDGLIFFQNITSLFRVSCLIPCENASPFFFKEDPQKAVRLFLSFNYKGDEFKNK